MLRQGIEEPEKRARFGAIYALSFLSASPLTFLSIRIFRTIHRGDRGGDPGVSGFSPDPQMKQTFMFSLVPSLCWRWIDLHRSARKAERKSRADETAPGTIPALF